MKRFRFIRNPLATEIGADVEAFLRYLGGPASIFLEGPDNSRTRAFVTLLHGNEPSGVMALFRWLKSGRQPAVNTLCIVASVGTALATPLFSQRILPSSDRDQSSQPQGAGGGSTGWLRSKSTRNTRGVPRRQRP